MKKLLKIKRLLFFKKIHSYSPYLSPRGLSSELSQDVFRQIVERPHHHPLKRKQNSKANAFSYRQTPKNRNNKIFQYVHYFVFHFFFLSPNCLFFAKQHTTTKTIPKQPKNRISSLKNTWHKKTNIQISNRKYCKTPGRTSSMHPSEQKLTIYALKTTLGAETNLKTTTIITTT